MRLRKNACKCKMHEVVGTCPGLLRASTPDASYLPQTENCRSGLGRKIATQQDLSNPAQTSRHDRTPHIQPISRTDMWKPRDARTHPPCRIRPSAAHPTLHKLDPIRTPSETQAAFNSTLLLARPLPSTHKPHLRISHHFEPLNRRSSNAAPRRRWSTALRFSTTGGVRLAAVEIHLAGIHCVCHNGAWIPPEGSLRCLSRGSAPRLASERRGGYATTLLAH